MVFEVRTYDPGDLIHPQTSVTHSFPIRDRIVQSRNLQLALTAVKGTTISYHVAFVPPAATPAGETEYAHTECQADGLKAVAPPSD